MMRGIVVMTVAMSFEDAGEIERRAEARMLRDSRRWSTRTAAVLAEIGFGEVASFDLVARRTGTPSSGIARPAMVMEADVALAGGGNPRRRALHDAYFEAINDEEDEEWEDESDE
jgi:hypothetical protein